MQFGKKEMRILMVGLDAAGKTTILYKLKLGEGEKLWNLVHKPKILAANLFWDSFEICILRNFFLSCV